MLNKIIFLSAARTGNHFILRSISKTLKIPYAVFIDYRFTGEKIKKEEKYVISMHYQKDHIEDFDIFDKNAKFFSIYRNPIDHAISLSRFYQIKFNPNDNSFIDFLNSDIFIFNRNIIKSCSDYFYFNYDILASSDSVEKQKHILDIEKEIGFKGFILEDINDTRKEHGFAGAPIGISGRWRNIITKETWNKVIETIDEPLNKFWDNPNPFLTKEEALENYLKDYKIGH